MVLVKLVFSSCQRFKNERRARIKFCVKVLRNIFYLLVWFFMVSVQELNCHTVYTPVLPMFLYNCTCLFILLRIVVAINGVRIGEQIY
jgi:LytS/YehU family sensor histidine kinase